MSLAIRLFRRWLARTVGELPVLKLTRIYDRVTRVTFELSPLGRRSAREIRAVKDVGRGRRAFILGNGPSLGTMDLEPLRHEVTFGMNRVYLLFEKLGFPTTFVVSVNDLVVEQFGRDILALERPTFLSWHSRRFVDRGEAPVFLPTSRAREFSRDPSRAIWEGATVTFVALQLAFHMGYDPVILIGVDHYFSTPGRAHRKVTSTSDDPNHFDPTYFGPGLRWNLPDLDTSEIAYKMARDAFEADGRRVLDATVGGHLAIFEKADFRELVIPDPPAAK